jgi:agmatinase
MTNEPVDSGIFLGLPPEFSNYENSKVVILPIPFDGTSTFMKGADRGPDALIKASQQVELFDIESQGEPYRVGVFTAPAVNGESGISVNQEAERRTTTYLSDQKFVLSLGGEHSVSLGPVKAHAQKYRNLSILQLDAHTDLRAEYHGDPLNHACIMARCLEFIPTVIQVGIRSMDVSEVSANRRENIFFAEHIVGTSGWIDQVVSRLSNEVYLTVDLDVFDPSLMPSTGTPEPGGLGWYEVLSLIRRVSQTRRIVGADIVELCPSANAGPDFVAAKLAYKIISYVTGTSRK